MWMGGDFDYDSQGADYAAQRRADPRIAAYIERALGDARTVLNVGAGAGSYEPLGRHVIALEPSATMRAQRPAHLAPAIHGVAEALPLDDRSVDAVMAVATVHQWSDLAKGLRELRRVSRGPVVVMAFDEVAPGHCWVNDYAPELLAAERRRYPGLEAIAAGVGARAEVQVVPIPFDCTDGFTEAFYGRPERLLEPAVRRAQSSWGFVPPEVEPRFVETLSADLASGRWDELNGAWRRLPAYEGSLRLVVGRG
ncbi:class I SAM-dependent methyltransferase [Phenylobacterium sp.]|uniref:class I SAM-dependent methyltransferase n=1 Tax=Phenylobacterium sp. TaxID=1871053 RepID=UPI0025D04A2C|nr:class I SAM-dependent methyltransferase [Phenylobacterium sp.]